MKATFQISEETQVLAIKQLEFDDDDLVEFELPAASYGLDMETSFRIIPGKEYDVLSVVDESPETVTIWINDTLCLPNFPKEKIRISHE